MRNDYTPLQLLLCGLLLAGGACVLIAFAIMDHPLGRAWVLWASLVLALLPAITTLDAPHPRWLGMAHLRRDVPMVYGLAAAVTVAVWQAHLPAPAVLQIFAGSLAALGAICLMLSRGSTHTRSPLFPWAPEGAVGWLLFGILLIALEVAKGVADPRAALNGILGLQIAMAVLGVLNPLPTARGGVLRDWLDQLGSCVPIPFAAAIILHGLSEAARPNGITTVLVMILSFCLAVVGREFLLSLARRPDG